MCLAPFHTLFTKVIHNMETTLRISCVFSPSYPQFTVHKFCILWQTRVR